MLKIIHASSAYLNKKGFFDLLIAKFLIQFLGFGTILLVAKFLTPTELGEIKIIQSYTGIFIILAGFGFNTAVLKICSERSTLEEKEGVLKLSLKRSLITSLLTCLLLTVLAYTGIITSSLHIARWLVIYAVAIPFIIITDLFMVFLQAQKKIKFMARIQAVIKAQSTVLIIFSTWKWGFSGFIYSTIAAFAIGLFPLVWQVGLDFTKAPLKETPRHFANYATFSMLGNLISQIGVYGDIFILDYFLLKRETIGFYSLATIFLMAAMQVTGVVQQITTPYFSENMTDKRWVIHQLTKNVLRMIGLSILVSFTIYIAAWTIITNFFAPEYGVTLRYLLILLFKYIIYSSYALVGAALVGLGFMKFNFMVAAISTPISLLLCYLGLKYYGILGMAWSTVLASLFTAILSFTSFMIMLRRS